MADINPLAAMAGGYQFGAQARQSQTQNALAGMLGNGDYQGAMSYAGQRGDLQSMQALQQTIAGMQEQERAAAKQRADAIGGVAASLLQTPYEQRAAALQQSLPLLTQIGLDAQQIASFDPTDANLNAVMGQVAPIADLLDRTDPQKLGENDVMSRTVGGREQIGVVNPNAPLNRAVETRKVDETVRSNQATEGLRAFEAQTGRMNADTSRMTAAQAPASQAFTQENTLRDEFQKITGDFRGIVDQYRVLKSAADQGTAQGDLAMVVAFTKLLDPGSVAREGEVNLSQSTQGVISQAQNWANQLQNGRTILPQEVRDRFVQAADEIARGYEQSYQTREQEYTGLAQRYGLDTQNVLVGRSSLPPQEAADEDLINKYLGGQ